jgi:hypothetical protein
MGHTACPSQGMLSYELLVIQAAGGKLLNVQKQRHDENHATSLLQ